MILNNRIKRDFKDNLARNISMALIIALSMALVVSLCSASDSISDTIYTEWAKCNVEDGNFETYIPLSNRNFKELSELNVKVEKMFYSDVAADCGKGDSTLRLFANRTAIDLPYAESGAVPDSDDYIFIEKNFAAAHNLKTGDTVMIGGHKMYVCGTGCLPDYSYVKQNSSDVAANDEFSVAVVTASAFNKLKGTNRVIYNYAYKLGSGCTVRELKNKLQHLTFDEGAVKDTYVKEKINAAMSIRRQFDSAAEGLKNGAFSLARGIDKLGNALPAGEAKDSTDKLGDGAMDLYYGASAMKEAFEGYIEETTEIDIVNLASFGEAKYNIRINDAIDDSQIGKQAALVCGVFLIILLVYMLSIFASGTIEQERPIIGTLYALGYSRGEILSHYIKIPMLVSAMGAIVGTAAGFMLTGQMAASSASLYSFPKMNHIFPKYLIAYGIGLPTVFSYLVNRLVLSRKLNTTPLKMMREAPRRSRGLNIKLSGMSFAAKYRIRQFLRELGGNITLFFGVTVALLLIMFSLACYGSINSYINGITDDIKFNYMYVLRNPVNELPQNSCVGYTRGFYVDYPMGGGEMEVTLLGVNFDNPYFDFAPYLSEDSDKIYMSDSVRIKFGYKTGDRVILRDNAEDKFYAFEVAGEVKYGNGLYFFMNSTAMRKAFGHEYADKEKLKTGERLPSDDKYYYNTVFSNEKMKFGHNMLMAEVSKADMKSGAEKFMTLMWSMILMLIGVSVIIFIAVMYLLMKLEIDRSSFSVSLLKALGYSEKTVNSFYIGSSFYVTLAAIVIGLPICRKIVDVAYPFCVSNVNAGFPPVVSPLQYLIIAAIAVLSYFATRTMLVRYLNKINVTEILKNRE